MQRVVNRYGLTAVITLIVAVFCIAASSAMLAWTYRDQVHELRHTLFARCEASVTRAEALAVALDALHGYYSDLESNLTANPSPQSRVFNARLIAHVGEVRQRLSEAADLAVPPSCDVYR